MGYEDGTAWGMDEYGRRPKDDDPKLKAQRDKEWKAFQQASIVGLCMLQHRRIGLQRDVDGGDGVLLS